jgi:hypothetical protein
MKKIFIYCVFFLAVSICILFAIGFGVGKYVDYQTSSIHAKYTNALKSDFKEGMSLEEAITKFPKYGAKFISLECSDGTFTKNACPDESRTHINIPLKGNFILGEGGVYIDLYFNKNKKLIGCEHYADYHRFH